MYSYQNSTLFNLESRTNKQANKQPTRVDFKLEKYSLLLTISALAIIQEKNTRSNVCKEVEIIQWASIESLKSIGYLEIQYSN